MGLAKDRTDRKQLMADAKQRLDADPGLRRDLQQRMKEAEKGSRRGPSSAAHKKPVSGASFPEPPPAPAVCEFCGLIHSLGGEECRARPNSNGNSLNGNGKH